MRTKPWLVCVEMRAERATPGALFYAPGAGDILQRLDALLAHARGNAWEVVHVHSRARRGMGGPIAGLEPQVNEAVFQMDFGSAFESAGLLGRAKGQACAALHFMGFAASEIILPTIVAGVGRGLRVAVVGDAVASSRHERWQASRVVAFVRRRLGPFAAPSTADLIAGRSAANVVRMEDFRWERDGERR
jgi:nicotinamidase-related amidase